MPPPPPTVKHDDDFSASLQQGASLALAADAEDVDQDFMDHYNLDAEGNDKHSLSQKMVHYCGGQIIHEHWIACKAVLAFYAGSAISKLMTMAKALKLAACLQLYLSAIDALDSIHFQDDIRIFPKILQEER